MFVIGRNIGCGSRGRRSVQHRYNHRTRLYIYESAKTTTIAQHREVNKDDCIVMTGYYLTQPVELTRACRNAIQYLYYVIVSVHLQDVPEPVFYGDRNTRCTFGVTLRPAADDDCVVLMA